MQRIPHDQGEDQSILRNPYVIAGLAVLGAIFLAVLVVIFGSSGGSGSTASDDGVIVELLTPVSGGALAARSISLVTVREGPGLDYVAIGELSRNQDVDVAGRNGEGNWYNIFFPIGSSSKGWVPATALRLPANPPPLPVVSVTPIPRPTVIQPTPTTEPTQSPSPTGSPTGTATPVGAVDLAASIVPGTCAVGQRLIVNIRNVGQAPINNRAVAVLVQAADGSQRALAAQTATIPPGGQIDIDTTYVVQERVVATIDPLGTLGDTNAGNNRVDCVVSVVPTVPGAGTSTPTRVPTGVVPPPIGSTPTRMPVP